MAENSVNDEFLCSELANQVKNEFLQLYVKIGQLLSASHFDDFFDILKNEVVILKTDAAIELFKVMLVSNLTKGFNQMWDFQHIPQSLSVLEYLKERYKNKQKPQWRPYGKSVLEQTLPLRVRLLEKKAIYLEKQLAFQKVQLESVIAKVENNRKYLEEMEQRRSQVQYNMETRCEKFTKLKQDIQELQLKAIEMKYS